MNSKLIELKILPQYFQAIADGLKTFEIREIRDRDFCVGDYLYLREHYVGAYTGRTCLVIVTYITDDVAFVKEGYCVMGIRRLIPEPWSQLSSE